MTSDKDVFENFSNFRGVDTRSSDLTRPIDAAKEAKNFIIEQNFSLGGEKGLHMFADYFDSEPIAGVHNYIYKNFDTGKEVEELLVLGKALYRLKAETFTITYGGGNQWGYDFLVDETDGELRLRLYDDGAVVLDYNVGTGLEDDTTGTTKLSTLEAQIDAITDFTATSDSTVDAIVAACFPLKAQYDLAAGAVNITVYRWEAVTFAVSGSASITSEGFNPYIFSHDQIATKPPIFLNRNNVCYIACDGKMPLMKYDGTVIRQAGAFTIFKEDIAVAASSNTPALVGTFRYYLRNVTRDSQGNYIYGAGAFSEVVTSASGEAPGFTMFDNTLGWEGDGYLIELGSDSTTRGRS